ncbi:hypothetical protein CEXT_366891 [Caerostris extrusa]|uniref:Uncharacterized protein n=1 Tax=Caerostris extrusa TaxID=172846 RepID=A0AAV4W6P5_CAEEX|nr:hypothetical protein CEXT_366891 [Caerostris extrusa]
MTKREDRPLIRVTLHLVVLHIQVNVLILRRNPFSFNCNLSNEIEDSDSKKRKQKSDMTLGLPVASKPRSSSSSQRRYSSINLTKNLVAWISAILRSSINITSVFCMRKNRKHLGAPRDFDDDEFRRSCWRGWISRRKKDLEGDLASEQTRKGFRTFWVECITNLYGISLRDFLCC